MTEPTVIPELPGEFSAEDYQTATSRVRAARERLLQADAARAAHDALVRTIAERVARRRASLAQLRKALGLTQAQMAETLGVDQAEVSKMERRLNHKLATLERFIEATGGTLKVAAVYGDVEVELKLGDLLSEVSRLDEPSPEDPDLPAKRATKTTSANRRAKASASAGNARTKTPPREGGMQKAVHVTRRNGGWAVTREGSKRAASIHPTQKEAAKAGRAIARKDGARLVLHDKNGLIKTKNADGDHSSSPVRTLEH